MAGETEIVACFAALAGAGEGRKMKRDRKEQLREYREKNREMLRAKAKEYYESHKAEAREKARKYRLENPEKKRANGRRWYRNNCERLKKKSKEWYESNRDRAKHTNHEYYLKHAEKKKRQARKYEAEHLADVRAGQRVRAQKGRKELSDVYIRHLLSFGTRVPAGTWPQEMVEAKRAQMALKREMK